MAFRLLGRDANPAGLGADRELPKALPRHHGSRDGCLPDGNAHRPGLLGRWSGRGIGASVRAGPAGCRRGAAHRADLDPARAGGSAAPVRVRGSGSRHPGRRLHRDRRGRGPVCLYSERRPGRNLWAASGPTHERFLSASGAATVSATRSCRIGYRGKVASGWVTPGCDSADPRQDPYEVADVIQFHEWIGIVMAAPPEVREDACLICYACAGGHTAGPCRKDVSRQRSRPGRLQLGPIRSIVW